VELAEGGGSRFVVELPDATRVDARTEAGRRAGAVEVPWPGS